jgi:hypothetical protein
VNFVRNLLEKFKTVRLLQDVASKGAEGVHVSGLGFKDKSVEGNQKI